MPTKPLSQVRTANFLGLNDDLALQAEDSSSSALTNGYKKRRSIVKRKGQVLVGEALEPLDAPTLLAATATGETTIDLTFTDNSTDEDGTKIERSLDGSTGWTVVGTNGEDDTTFTDTGLTAATQYYYRVRAYRGATVFSAYSNTANATTDAAGLSTADMLWDFNAVDIVGLNDGDSVSTWADSSPNGYDATDGSSTTPPTYQTNEINGLPVVQIASGQGLNIAFGTISPAETVDDLTIYLVCDYTPSGGFKVLMQAYEDPELGIGLDYPNNFYGAGDPTGNSIVVETSDGTGFNQKHNWVAAASGAQLLTFVLDKAGASLTIYRDGVELTEAGTGQNYLTHTLGSDTIELFHFASAAHLIGKVGRFVAYKVAHDGVTRAANEAILMADWGL